MQPIHNRVATLLLCLGSLWPSLTACDVDEPCDPGQRFEEGACFRPVPPPPNAGGDAGVDAAVPPAAMADAGASCEQALGDALGESCTASSECGCAAGFCALMPGQATGYCTIPRCDPAADECPEGYYCFDLSAMRVTGVEPFCARR